MNAYEERILDIKEAREQGEERGRSEGEKSGRAAEKLEMAKAMKSDNEPVDKIAKYTGLSKAKIEML